MTQCLEEGPLACPPIGLDIGEALSLSRRQVRIGSFTALFRILIILTFLFRAGFITGGLIVFDFIPIIDAFFGPCKYVMYGADPSHLSDSLLTFNFSCIMVLNLACLQKGSVIVLNLFNASAELILKKKGQRKKLAKDYKEKEECTPKIMN